MTVLAIGVAPETDLQGYGAGAGETGAIKCDHNYRTSDPDIYAVGDAIEVSNRLTHRPSRLALAGTGPETGQGQRQTICTAYPIITRGHWFLCGPYL